MTVPSQMSLRRIPEELHLQVRIAYATAWEALISTHTSQAEQFLCEFASRVPVLEGMDLYFRVTAVPEAMQEVVRSRTLTSLDLESLPTLTPMPVLTGWQRFRLDHLLEQQRYRRRFRRRPSSWRAWSARGPRRPSCPRTWRTRSGSRGC